MPIFGLGFPRTQQKHPTQQSPEKGKGKAPAPLDIKTQNAASEALSVTTTQESSEAFKQLVDRVLQRISGEEEKPPASALEEVVFEFAVRLITTEIDRTLEVEAKKSLDASPPSKQRRINEAPETQAKDVAASSPSKHRDSPVRHIDTV